MVSLTSVWMLTIVADVAVNEEWDILPLNTTDQGTSRTSAEENWSDMWQSPLTDHNSDTKVCICHG